jgi:hypothetical protein
LVLAVLQRSIVGTPKFKLRHYLVPHGQRRGEHLAALGAEENIPTMIIAPMVIFVPTVSVAPDELPEERRRQRAATQAASLIGVDRDRRVGVVVVTDHNAHWSGPPDTIFFTRPMAGCSFCCSVWLPPAFRR